MRCDRCNEMIEKAEEMAFHEQTLCEKCYMEALSPPRACDPWAVYNAKSLSRRVEGYLEINETQASILELLKKTGGLSLSDLSERLGVKTALLMREIAALRHMERLKAELRDGKQIFVLWPTQLIGMGRQE